MVTEHFPCKHIECIMACDTIVYYVSIYTQKTILAAIEENVAVNQCVQQELDIFPFAYFLPR